VPLPRAVTRFNRAILNRLLSPAAKRLPAFGIVVHRGRKSGRVYRTPVNIFKQPNGYVVPLTYGVGDWERNVLAAGECTLETRGRSYHMTQPRLVHDEERRAVPAILRFVGAVGGVSDFLYLSHEARSSTGPPRRSRRVPVWIRLFNPLSKLLLAVGVPMGPDVLLTVPGRKSGLPRTTPVAVAEMAGRWWLVGPFGDVDWARNLRVSGRATLTIRRVKEEVTAVEMAPAERAEFFREIVNPYLRAHPAARWIVRNLDQIPEDPVAAAEEVIVFEVIRGGRGRTGRRPDATRSG
jgi:deazaflavin-dependent oxidoreductase (nitroreductase family)